MKFRLIHHQYAKSGGMESYLLDLLEGLSLQGDEIEILCMRRDEKLPLPDDVTLHCFNLKNVPKKLRIYAFARQVAKHPAHPASLSLTRTWKQNIVVCGGTHRGFLSSMQKFPSPLDLLTLYMEKKSFRHSPWIVAHSPMIAEEIQNFYRIPAAKIKMLYPPLNTQRFHRLHRRRRAALRREYGFSPNKISLLAPVVGQRRKAVPALLEAFKLLPAEDFELIIAGSRVRDTAPHVKSLGFQQNMEELYSAADFTILPSYYEPFGLVVAESLQCGTPVIVSERVGARGLVSKQDGLVFSDLSPAGIAQAVQNAAAASFSPVEDFAHRHGLSIEAHILELKKLPV